MDELSPSGELMKSYPEALSRAVRLLALRPRSRMETSDRLTRYGYSDETVDMVMCKLENEGLLNDGKFAREWALSRVRGGLGKARIARELRQKGVDTCLIDEALSELDADELDEQAASLARKLLKRYDGYGPEKAVEKALGGMVRRGFSYGASARALEKAIKEER